MKGVVAVLWGLDWELKNCKVVCSDDAVMLGFPKKEDVETSIFGVSENLKGVVDGWKKLVVFEGASLGFVMGFGGGKLAPLVLGCSAGSAMAGPSGRKRLSSLTVVGPSLSE